MPRIIEGVRLTRMDLMKTRTKIRLATKGHKLLKEKRDALITEFFKVVENAKGIRGELSENLVQGRVNLIKTKALMGTNEVQSIANSTPAMGEVEFGFRNIMGVKIPVLQKADDIDEKKMSYTLMYATPKLEESTVNFSIAAQKLIRLIESEETVKRVGNEIKKVKRRTNALEYILIPNLEYTKKYIEMRLQEIERENFFRLKVVKKKKMKK
ncbi:MAG: V-type ATP synthase subunit D [Candidatus Aenigmarchaeota archaeon]|nr:V-type ATP synthase subunit D [Candidatus Aenigmarchaeota archaeon]